MDEPVDAALLVDTSLLIDFFRKQDKSKAALFHLVDRDRLYISVITAFEVKVGITSERQQRDFDLLTKNMEVLPLDAQCADKAADVYQNLKARNALIGLADLLIAATALRHGLPVATFNEKHFERIESLELVDPVQDR